MEVAIFPLKFRCEKKDGNVLTFSLILHAFGPWIGLQGFVLGFKLYGWAWDLHAVRIDVWLGLKQISHLATELEDMRSACIFCDGMHLLFIYLFFYGVVESDSRQGVSLLYSNSETWSD